MLLRSLLLLTIGCWTLPLSAAQILNPVAGSLSASENGCNYITSFLFGTDCTYGADGTGTWGGPGFIGAYYEAGSPEASIYYAPASGDGRIAPQFTGQVIIDDNNTAGNGSDDVISAIFTVGPAARNIYTGNASQAVESWTSLTHTLAATAVDSATANAFGGFDYIIGLQGLPTLICAAANPSDCYSSGDAPPTGSFNVGFWSGPSPIGVERNANQGGNAGAATTAAFSGYGCAATVATDCTVSPFVWGGGEDPGFDNLLLRIVTNSAGAIVSADGFWTQEWQFSGFGAPLGDNSWVGGTLQFVQVVPLPAAAWLMLGGLGSLAFLRRRPT